MPRQARLELQHLLVAARRDGGRSRQRLPAAHAGARLEHIDCGAAQGGWGWGLQASMCIGVQGGSSRIR